MQGFMLQNRTEDTLRVKDQEQGTQKGFTVFLCNILLSLCMCMMECRPLGQGSHVKSQDNFIKLIVSFRRMMGSEEQWGH